MFYVISIETIERCGSVAARAQNKLLDNLNSS